MALQRIADSRLWLDITLPKGCNNNASRLNASMLRAEQQTAAPRGYSSASAELMARWRASMSGRLCDSSLVTLDVLFKCLSELRRRSTQPSVRCACLLGLRHLIDASVECYRLKNLCIDELKPLDAETQVSFLQQLTAWLAEPWQLIEEPEKQPTVAASNGIPPAPQRSRSGRHKHDSSQSIIPGSLVSTDTLLPDASPAASGSVRRLAEEDPQLRAVAFDTIRHLLSCLGSQWALSDAVDDETGFAYAADALWLPVLVPVLANEPPPHRVDANGDGQPASVVSQQQRDLVVESLDLLRNLLPLSQQPGVLLPPLSMGPTQNHCPPYAVAHGAVPPVTVVTTEAAAAHNAAGEAPAAGLGTAIPALPALDLKGSSKEHPHPLLPAIAVCLHALASRSDLCKHDQMPAAWDEAARRLCTRAGDCSCDTAAAAILARVEVEMEVEVESDAEGRHQTASKGKVKRHRLKEIEPSIHMLVTPSSHAGAAAWNTWKGLLTAGVE